MLILCFQQTPRDKYIETGKHVLLRKVWRAFTVLALLERRV